MKKNLKIITVLLIPLLLNSCKTNNTGDNKPEDVGPVVHEFVPTVYTSNGIDISDYVIVVPHTKNATVDYAASELVNYIKKSADCTLNIVLDTAEKSDHEILLGNVDREAVSSIDFNELGEESYRIKNVGNDLVIAANQKRGLLYGVYSFLEALGYRFFTPTLETIPDDVFVPNDIDLSWTPTFEYRDTMFCCMWNPAFAVKQKVNSSFQRNDFKIYAKYGGYADFIGGGKGLVHTFKHLLPPATYKAAHPLWYAQNVANAGNYDYLQPCFSNFESIDTIFANACAWIDAEPEGKIISLSQNDGGDFCNCDLCTENYRKYGKSGTMLRWVNKIAKKIKDKYAPLGRDIEVDTLAYSPNSLEAPIDTVAEDNVAIRFCTEMCPFHNDDNPCEVITTKEQYFHDWKNSCDKFYVWTYPISWGNLYNSWPNYKELKDSIEFYAKNGVVGLYQEGYPLENCEFGEMKAYVLSKLAINPLMSDEEFEYHMSDFMKAYYGEGWKELRAFINEAHDRILERQEKLDIHMTTHYSVSELFDFKWDPMKNTYDMDFIKKMNKHWEKALDVADGDEIDHVIKSSLHWTYIELYNTFEKRYLYGSLSEMEDLESRNEELYRNLWKYGAIYKYDGKKISNSITDFKSSPEYW